jgi:hypothetical protein
MNKAANAEVFIWLDTVQYRKNYFQNRTRIVGTSGNEEWLTLPVRASFGCLIRDTRIVGERWRERIVRTIEQAYSKARFFDEYWPPLLRSLDHPSDSLSRVNLGLFHELLASIGLSQVAVVVADELPVESADPTTRLVELCRAVGATRYLAGKSGREYLDVQQFAEHGIEVEWQDFDTTRAAYSRPDGALAQNLSVIDSLFNLGAAETLQAIQRGWTRHPEPQPQSLAFSVA